MPTAQPRTPPSDQLDTRQLLRVLTAIKKGDFSARMPDDQIGVAGKVADTLNDIIDMNRRLTQEYARISAVVGKEGRISQRVTVPEATGDWASRIESVNSLIADLAQPT